MEGEGEERKETGEERGEGRRGRGLPVGQWYTSPHLKL